MNDAAGWETRPPTELADHIEAHVHEALRRDVPPLIAAAREIERVHAASPDLPTGLANELAALWEELQRHMRRDETILFPLLRLGLRGTVVALPVRVLLREHDEHSVRLAHIGDLTGRFTPPRHASASWRALYVGLARVEAELTLHMRLENILAVRATSG
jgi:regulator of cell morphogenesis and NO signaling